MIILKLNEVLDAKRKTAYQVAKATGLHQSVISKFRRGEAKMIALDVLDLLCDELDCKPSDLIVHQSSKADAEKPSSKPETPQTTASDGEWLETKEAAELTGLKPRTVREYAEKGELQGKQNTKKHWLFRREAVEDFIARRS